MSVMNRPSSDVIDHNLTAFDSLSLQDFINTNALIEQKREELSANIHHPDDCKNIISMVSLHAQ